VGLFFSDPYRYWPRYAIHDVVLPEVKGPPEVETAHAACVRMLKKIGIPRSA
jgi:hypothetical protein